MSTTFIDSLQPEEVDAKAAEIISETVLKQLADTNWKERLAGIEALSDVSTCMCDWQTAF